MTFEAMTGAGGDLTTLLAGLFESFPLGFGVFDTELRHVLVNDALADLNGVPAGELIGRRPSEVHGEIGERAEELYRQVLELRQPVLDVELSGPTARSDGESRHFAMHYFPVLDPAGQPLGVAVVVVEISRRKQVEQELRKTTELFRALIDGVQDYAITTLDAEGRITSWNEGAQRIFGYGADAAIGRPVHALYVEEEPADARRQLAAAAAEGRAVTEGWRARADGSRFYAHSVLTALRATDGRVEGFVKVTRDVTRYRETEAALRHQALHDGLTGLPNRTLFADRLGQALARAARTGEQVGLLLLDLDRFKLINDTLGHNAGDIVLQEVATRLPLALRDEDTVARLGGDEFAVVLPQLHDAGEAVEVARRIGHLLRRPVRVHDLDLDLDGSIGVSVYPRHGQTAEDLLRYADVAMYHAKQEGRLVALYRPELDGRTPQQLTMVGDLRADIAAERLHLEYQPKVDLTTRRIVTLEALVRWPRNGAGQVPPDVFIPIAEETGLIKPLTALVLRQAAGQLAAWRRSGVAARVAVNVSARSLHDPDLHDTVVGAAEGAAIDPAWLELEVTESALLANRGVAESTMQRLSDLGVRFSLDDFGTGYSSLSHVRSLPIDEIKVDRTFVKGVLSEPHDETIVRAVVDLARNLGMRAVAEGVEDAAIRERVLRLGCRYGQGFGLFRPAPAHEITPHLAA